MKQEGDRLRQAVQSLEEESVQLREINDQWQARSQELENELNEASSNNSELRANLDNAKLNEVELRRQIVEVRQSQQELQTLLEQSRASKSELQEKLAEMAEKAASTPPPPPPPLPAKRVVEPIADKDDAEQFEDAQMELPKPGSDEEDKTTSKVDAKEDDLSDEEQFEDARMDELPTSEGVGKDRATTLDSSDEDVETDSAYARTLQSSPWASSYFKSEANRTAPVESSRPKSEYGQAASRAFGFRPPPQLAALNMTKSQQISREANKTTSEQQRLRDAGMLVPVPAKRNVPFRSVRKWFAKTTGLHHFFSSRPVSPPQQPPASPQLHRFKNPLGGLRIPQRNKTALSSSSPTFGHVDKLTDDSKKKP